MKLRISSECRRFSFQYGKEGRRIEREPERYSYALLWILFLFTLTTGAVVAEQPRRISATSTADQIKQMEAMCESRKISSLNSSADRTLFDRIGGEARIHVVTREMVRLHHLNPTVADIVRRYNPEYLADILAGYLITATGGPRRYEGPPLQESHAHLHLSNAHFLAGGEDFFQAMKNVGIEEEAIAETMCLLGQLRHEIVQD